VIEFALVLPILAALVIALLQCGKIIYGYIGVNGLAQQAARYATVNKFPAGADPGGYVCSKTGAKGLAVAWGFSTVTPVPGDTVTVTVSHDYSILQAFKPVKKLIPIHVGVSAAMRLEQKPSFGAGSTTCT
jgi:hypothetical protein